MVTAAPEAFRSVFEEFQALTPGHWDKLALDKDIIPLDPRWDLYFAKDLAGELLFVALRDAGRLVGYWIAFIAPGLHFKTCLTAQMDIWDILPDYETTGSILALMRAVEDEYKRRGVMRSYVAEKLHKPCGKLYKSFGYEPVETYYSKLTGG